MSLCTVLLVAGGIYSFFFAHGIVQQQLYQFSADTGDGSSGGGGGGGGGQQATEQFTFTYSLLFLSCIANVAMASAVLTLQHSGAPHRLVSSLTKRLDRPALTEFILTALTLVLAKFASWHSLTLVDYPTQSLAKCAKPVSILLLSLWMGSRRYSLAEAVIVVWLVGSLGIFNLSKVRNDGNAVSTLTGNVLLLISLACDGLTGSRQDKIATRCHFSSWEMMCCINFFSLIFAGIGVLVFEGAGLWAFTIRHPNVYHLVGLFCACGALGQGFTYIGIRTLGALHTSLITTTRKLFMVLVSVIWFNTSLRPMQWAAVVSVFAAVFAKTWLKLRQHPHPHPHPHPQSSAVLPLPAVAKQRPADTADNMTAEQPSETTGELEYTGDSAAAPPPAPAVTLAASSYRLPTGYHLVDVHHSSHGGKRIVIGSNDASSPTSSTRCSTAEMEGEDGTGISTTSSESSITSMDCTLVGRGSSSDPSTTSNGSPFRVHQVPPFASSGEDAAPSSAAAAMPLDGLGSPLPSTNRLLDRPRPPPLKPSSHHPDYMPSSPSDHHLSPPDSPTPLDDPHSHQQANASEDVTYDKLHKSRADKGRGRGRGIGMGRGLLAQVLPWVGMGMGMGVSRNAPGLLPSTSSGGNNETREGEVVREKSAHSRAVGGERSAVGRGFSPPLPQMTPAGLV